MTTRNISERKIPIRTGNGERKVSGSERDEESLGRCSCFHPAVGGKKKNIGKTSRQARVAQGNRLENPFNDSYQGSSSPESSITFQGSTFLPYSPGGGARSG